MTEMKSPNPAGVVCLEELWSMGPMSPAIRRQVDEIVRADRRESRATRAAVRASAFRSIDQRVFVLDRKREMAELLSSTLRLHVPSDLREAPRTPAELFFGGGVRR